MSKCGWRKIYRYLLSPDQKSTPFHTITKFWCFMKCCTHLATLLYQVVSWCIKFDCDQTFSLNKCCTIQHFFSLRDVIWCYSRLATPYNFVVLCCTHFWRSVVSCCTKCCIRLVTPLLNTIKQPTTKCNKCCMVFYEMLNSFGRGFRVSHENSDGASLPPSS